MLVLSRSTMFVQTCRVLFHVRQSYIWKGPMLKGASLSEAVAEIAHVGRYSGRICEVFVGATTERLVVVICGIRGVMGRLECELG